jgi:exopolysaccharide production protein ExoZ
MTHGDDETVISMVHPSCSPSRNAVLVQNLQTLRVLFAFLVVTGHLQALYAQMGLVDMAHPINGLATEGFLIVSAFVLTLTSLRRPRDGVVFLGRRLRRLVPFYWLVTLIVAALAILTPSLFQTTRVTPETLLKSLLFIPYLKHGDTIAPIVFVGWTMNYFVYFVVLHALMMKLFGRYAWCATAAILASLSIFGALFHPTDIVTRFLTGPRQFSLGLGVALAGLWNLAPMATSALRRAGPRLLAAGLIIGGFVLRFGQQIYFPAVDSALVAPFASLSVVLGVLALERNGDRFESRMRDNLAEATFAIYLTHYFATQAATKAAELLHADNPLSLGLLVLSAYAGAGMLGLLACRWLEKPLDVAVREVWNRIEHVLSRMRHSAHGTVERTPR